MQEKYIEAVKKYQEAISTLPLPVEQWKYIWVLLVSVSENYWLNAKFNDGKDGGYQEALDVYQQIMQIELAIGDPSYHSKIGQIRYELGQFEKAKDELLRAYLIKGMYEFSYMYDPKYFELIRPIIEDISYQNNINNSNYKF
ncbi:MAG: tetratricopeptide repeat protein [Bacteroidia bacterium]|nr:tetratricopeptide repeat protein [Bacteroidia bacterium]